MYIYCCYYILLLLYFIVIVYCFLFFAIIFIFYIEIIYKNKNGKRTYYVDALCCNWGWFILYYGIFLEPACNRCTE
jgi:hypothetical protein